MSTMKDWPKKRTTSADDNARERLARKDRALAAAQAKRRRKAQRRARVATRGAAQ